MIIITTYIYNNIKINNNNKLYIFLLCTIRKNA